MAYIIGLVILLTLFSLTYGFILCDWFGFEFQFNVFKSPYYRFGISFEPLHKHMPDNTCYNAWVFTLGLIFLNVVIEFGGKFTEQNDTEA